MSSPGNPVRFTQTLGSLGPSLQRAESGPVFAAKSPPTRVVAAAGRSRTISRWSSCGGSTAPDVAAEVSNGNGRSVGDSDPLDGHPPRRRTFKRLVPLAARRGPPAPGLS